MNGLGVRRLEQCQEAGNCTRTVSNESAGALEMVDLPQARVTEESVTDANYHRTFPTVNVPDHAHYTIGAVILAVGVTGMVGNFLVIYAFCRSKSLRSPSNTFIINLAISDFLMSITQAPIFFTTSLHKRWIFGEKGCELYAFCGALFGITSMITLVVIAADRYLVITRPLASIGMLSKKRAIYILLGVWLYSLAWSLPPFFGWSAYVPEGLMTSCTWDYTTFTPSVRAYTMLLFCFVFFIPLGIIIYCYVFIFRAILATNRDVEKIGGNTNKESRRRFQRIKNEWKMAKIALIVILLYVISWSPYSTVALTAFAGYADVLTPYMNSVPAVIAKASAIHNPIIYAITHPKYRAAIVKYIPFLGCLLRLSRKDYRLASSYFSTRQSTMTSQTSNSSGNLRPKSRMSASDSESGWTDNEVDISIVNSRPVSRTVSCEFSKDTTEQSDTKEKSKLKNNDSGIFEKVVGNLDGVGLKKVDVALVQAAQIPSIVITHTSSPGSSQSSVASFNPMYEMGIHGNQQSVLPSQ
ncbi:melanopsin-A isoform X2 [Chiloscyllium plagiosum]|uniref:melanopsin-A isoform X2 n=1 Tax=Chiloscyllium plagiosum TaxID=36176 RepID=UPI001CB7C259|nr:melanopsin-A isoform X2 [Chiloscyllium plagiosum]